MEVIIAFAVKYRIVFIILSVLFLLALIGYFVDNKRRKEIPARLEEEDIDLTTFTNNNNVSINEMLNKNSMNNSNNSTNTNV